MSKVTAQLRIEMIGQFEAVWIDYVQDGKVINSRPEIGGKERAQQLVDAFNRPEPIVIDDDIDYMAGRSNIIGRIVITPPAESDPE